MKNRGRRSNPSLSEVLAEALAITRQHKVEKGQSPDLTAEEIRIVMRRLELRVVMGSEIPEPKRSR